MVRFHPYLSAHAVGEVFYDGQAQACPANRTGAAGIHPVEPLEESRAVLTGHSSSIIDDLDAHLSSDQVRTHPDVPIFCAVLHGVLDEVGEDLLEGTRVADALSGGWHLVVQCNLLALRQRPYGADRLLCTPLDVDWNPLSRECSGLDPGQIQEVRDQVGEPLSISVDGTHEVPCHRLVFERAL